MTTTINATNPVTVQLVDQMIFDKFYLTQLVGKFSATTGPTVVTLQRANLTNGVWTLMPNSSPNSTVTFNLDIFKEIAGGNTTLATAFDAVVASIDAYATTKKLI